MFGVSLGIFQKREKEEAGLLLKENLYLTLCLSHLLFMDKNPNVAHALGLKVLRGWLLILFNFYSKKLNLLENYNFFFFSYLTEGPMKHYSS